MREGREAYDHERRDPSNQFELEQAYNHIFHLMVQLEEERDFWCRWATRAALVNVALLLVFAYQIWCIW